MDQLETQRRKHKSSWSPEGKAKGSDDDNTQSWQYNAKRKSHGQIAQITCKKVFTRIGILAIINPCAIPSAFFAV